MEHNNFTTVSRLRHAVYFLICWVAPTASEAKRCSALSLFDSAEKAAVCPNNISLCVQCVEQWE